MKFHKVHPLPTKDGRQREILIELTVKELGGLLQICETTLDSPNLKKDGRIFLSFENRLVTEDPAIQCYYDKVD